MNIPDGREERHMQDGLDMDVSGAIATAVLELTERMGWTHGDDLHQAWALALRTRSLHEEIMQGPVAEECVYRAYEATMSDLAMSASDACRLAVLRGRIAVSEIEPLCLLDPWSYHPTRRDGPSTVAGDRNTRR